MENEIVSKITLKTKNQVPEFKRSTFVTGDRLVTCHQWLLVSWRGGRTGIPV